MDGTCNGRCGKCCDGTLFPYALLTDEADAELARNLGMTVRERTGRGGTVRLTFDLPCPLVTAAGLCSIYGQARPAICSSFVCPPKNLTATAPALSRQAA